MGRETYDLVVFEPTVHIHPTSGLDYGFGHSRPHVKWVKHRPSPEQAR